MTFEEAIERVLSHEGGYTAGEGDPGGETQWGISKRSYPHIDIKALTRDQAKAIYRSDFWTPVSELPSALRFQGLDAAVNHGIGNALRFIQRAVDVADDGVIGPVTRRAIAEFVERRGISDLLLRFLAQRLRFMCKLRTFPRFGAGWGNRIATNLEFAAEDN